MKNIQQKVEKKKIHFCKNCEWGDYPEKCIPQTEELGTTVAEKECSICGNPECEHHLLLCANDCPTCFAESDGGKEWVKRGGKLNYNQPTPKVAEEKECSCGAEEKSYSDTITFPNKIVLNPPTKAEEWA